MYQQARGELTNPMSNEHHLGILQKLSLVPLSRRSTLNDPPPITYHQKHFWFQPIPLLDVQRGQTT